MPTDRSQFIVPAGLELEHGPEGLVIRVPGDVVLLKASRGVALERLLPLLPQLG